MSFYSMSAILNKSQKKGKIIVVHGFSSCGKTSSTKTLFNLLNSELVAKHSNYSSPFIYIDSDHYISRLPSQWINTKTQNSTEKYRDDANPRGLYYVADSDSGKKMLNIHLGEDIYRTFNGIFNEVKGFADAGLNVLFEGALTTDLLKHLKKKLNGYSVFYVNIKCNLEKAEQREIKRNGIIGQTRGQFRGKEFRNIDSLFADKNSFTVNNDEHTPEETGTIIFKKYLENLPTNTSGVDETKYVNILLFTLALIFMIIFVNRQ